MARNDVGKWVARAGATGGGRTYRGRTPFNWYAVVTLIVVLGCLSVIYSNNEYRHSSSSTKTTTTPPRTGTTWSAGLAIDVCGTVQPSLPSDQMTTGKSAKPFSTSGNGVISIDPQKGTDAGKNATFGKFIHSYPGLALTGTKLTLPVGRKPVTYKNGEICPKGTPDHGKAGQIQGRQWGSVFLTKTKGSVIQGNPATLRFTQNQLISVGFVPSGAKLPKPNGTVVTALINSSSAVSSTTPSSPVSVATTVQPPTAVAHATVPSPAPSPSPTAKVGTTHPHKSSAKK